MPRRKMNLIEKVRVVYYWLKKYGSVCLILTCGRCDSADIELVKSKEEGRLTNSSKYTLYTATYHCRSCGATGSSKQEWVD